MADKIFDQVRPTIQIAYPKGFDQSEEARRLGIKFAEPSIPDTDQLATCYDLSNDESEFFSCVADSALPEDYRLTKDCLSQHSDDAGAALLCSSGNENALEKYRRFREVQTCAGESSDNFDVAACLGDHVLGENERYYMHCITDNKGDLQVAAVCAVAKGLNPEQQIALSCAISTGGQPHAFAACTGGRLATRELGKCWDHGIGTNDGCFGPNNELRRAADSVRREVCNVTGRNSEACRVYTYWHNNVLAPGPNHEVVKRINNAIGDIRNGPGENNEFVKAGRQIGNVFQSVGSALGF